MAAKVLIIEDDRSIAEILRYNLEKHGYSAASFSDGRRGYESAVKDVPDLVLLDLMLPEMDGLEICRRLRCNYKTRTTPILILTARAEDADEVLGLENGADDYLIKPFKIQTLMARIKAILRRARTESEPSLLTSGGLEIDTARFQARADGQILELTFKEYGILKFLLKCRGRVLSREKILEEVWGHDESLHTEPRVVDKHIGELRRKLKSAGARIVTVVHSGYRLAEEGEEDLT